MNEEALFFNGINGATGSYGLQPMTRKDLADHILRGTGKKSDEREKIEGQLKRGHAKKLAAIVRLLAKSSLEKVERDAAWESTWLRTLAEVLATEFLGDEHAEPDQLEALEDRLRHHTEGRGAGQTASGRPG
jgi:RNA polymerase-interacting CarD/CdnL/TRCF family regulator